MKWKPIKTAPKDGTWFLAIGNEKLHDVVSWLPYEVVLKWWAEDADGVWYNGAMDEYYAPQHKRTLTHWMPLPEPTI
jgi:hypothetical protein